MDRVKMPRLQAHTLRKRLPLFLVLLLVGASGATLAQTAIDATSVNTQLDPLLRSMCVPLTLVTTRVGRVIQLAFIAFGIFQFLTNDQRAAKSTGMFVIGIAVLIALSPQLVQLVTGHTKAEICAANANIAEPTP